MESSVCFHSKHLRIALCIVILGVVMYLSIFYKLVAVSGSSMEPTYTDGQFLLMQANYSQSIILHRGDVVAVNIPTLSRAYNNAIKRVVAIEGDEVIVDGNKVEVNGICTYLSDNWLVAYPYKTYKLKHNEVFLLGDNLSYSIDSRDEKIGIVNTSNVYAYKRGDTN